MRRPIRHRVVSVKQRLLSEATHMLVLGQVEDLHAFPSRPHQAGETKLGEVLRDRRRLRPNMLRECSSAQMIRSRVGSPNIFSISTATDTWSSVGSVICIVTQIA